MILKDRVLIRVGKANGLRYTEPELKPVVDVLNSDPPLDNPAEANRDSLFLDHGDGTETWVGVAKNFRWDDERKAIIGDLEIVDSETKNKIQFQLDEGRARFGISPRLTLRPERGVAKDIRIRSFSIVINPAGGRALMLWENEFLDSVEKRTRGPVESIEGIDAGFTVYGEVVKVDSDKHYVLGPVLIPEMTDLQDEIISASEIEKTAHNFLKDLISGTASPAVMHMDKERDIDVVESYLMPTDAVLDGRFIKKGTWMIGFIVNDPEVWRKVKDQSFRGFSVHGDAYKEPV